jgi:hypothetical protein
LKFALERHRERNLFALGEGGAEIRSGSSDLEEALNEGQVEGQVAPDAGWLALAINRKGFSGQYGHICGRHEPQIYGCAAYVG